jgi:lysine 2,3-aminomutase
MTIVRPIKTVDDLGEAGLVGGRDRDRAALEEVAARYAIALTPAISRLIDRTDPDDPIARQFVPRRGRTVMVQPKNADPIGDARP